MKDPVAPVPRPELVSPAICVPATILVADIIGPGVPESETAELGVAGM